LSLPLDAALALADLVRVGISVIDLVDPHDPETWTIQFNNAAAAEASQFDVRPLQGTRFLESFPAVRGTPFVDWYREVQLSGEEREIPEIRYGDDNVPDAAFRVWLTPLPGTLVLGQYVNVTLQRRAEGRLMLLNEQLSALVEERTEALRDSLDMLQQVSYASAHDLQTPIVQILRLAKLLETEVGEAGAEDLADLQAGARSAKQRLDAMLRYTAMVVTSDPVDDVDVKEVVERTLAGMPELVNGADVQLEVAGPPIRVQPERFELLVQQLLDNALRYHHPDSAREVALRVTPTEAGGCRLEVRDNGIGIPEANRDDVFQAFRRLHARERFAGIGMGLTIARTFVRSVGGTIDLTSSPDGTEVVVELPAAASG